MAKLDLHTLAIFALFDCDLSVQSGRHLHPAQPIGARRRMSGHDETARNQRNFQAKGLAEHGSGRFEIGDDGNDLVNSTSRKNFFHHGNGGQQSHFSAPAV